MDNLTLRRIIAAAGIAIAFLGLTSFLWGLLKNDQRLQLLGFISILVAYVLMVVVRRLKASKAPDKGSKLK